MTTPTIDAAALAAARARLAAEGVEVLFEDHLVLGVAKAAGVLSQPGPAGETSLVERIGAYRRETEGKVGRAFVGIVHRLDRNVSGAMVVAKSSKAASRLSAAFRERDRVEKTYLAWVAGSLKDDRGTLRSTLSRDDATRVTSVVEDGDDEGKEAVLDWEVEARSPSVSRVRVRLRTGATHQIRAQLAAIGHPLVGDGKYGGPATAGGARLDRPALHALRLVVPHPVGGALLTFEAPVTRDLAAFDRRVGLSPPGR